MGRGGRSRNVALSSHHAHSDLNGVGHDTHRADNLLGPDGLFDHGWTSCRHRFDADLLAGTIRNLLSREPTKTRIALNIACCVVNAHYETMRRRQRCR